MPPIISITQVDNSFTIVCSDTSLGVNGVITVRKTDIPGNIRNSQNLPVVETWINDRVKTFLSYVDEDGVTQQRFYVYVKVLGNNPNLQVQVTSSWEPIDPANL